MLSCAEYASNIISELIYRISILSEINESFPLVNMTWISFAILFSAEADYARLLADNTKGGSNI